MANLSGSPAQNFMVADDKGRIAWTILGRIRGAWGLTAGCRLHGRTIGWDGYLTPDEYPRIVDPAGGQMWTANARVVDGEMLAKVGDADVDNALQEIANQKRAIRAVDEPAQEGDFVKVDLRFLDEAGAEVHVRKGVQLNTRIPVAGTDPQAFAQALTGAQKGGSIELPLTFPDNFEKDAFRGKPGKAVLEVHEVLRVTPAAIDDALAKSLDFDNLAALRADLLARIGQEKIRVGKLRQEEQALEQVLAMHQFELPPSLVEEQTRASLATVRPPPRAERPEQGRHRQEARRVEGRGPDRRPAAGASCSS